MLTIRIKIILSTLIITTVAAGYALARFSHIEDPLLPREKSAYPWRISSGTDREDGGASTVALNDSAYHINLDFNLANAIPYPYVTLGMTFDDTDNKHLEDWSSYSSMMLRIKCQPANVLNLALLTYDEKVTQYSPDVRTFRPSLVFVSCGEEWRTIQIDLDRLDTPEWWLRRYNRSLADRGYALDKVRGIALSTSTQSATNTPSNVMIQEFVIKGKNLPVIYSLSALIVVMWAGFIGWALYQFYFYLARGKAEVVHEIVPVAYQAVPIEPRHEREKEAVLDYMASQYSRADLSVDIAVNELGINRIKINEILRAATGLTFSLYLNKLRLTEAARLLSDKQVGVAEAAFAVGYNSLSYFNRLFKKEFGCNPSSYKGPAATFKSTVST
ncbi:MAG TPA: helix-turn-helix transcriptional regulator [Cellvibrio sp.]|nr:helix-turn-helix transcriptional regulator [Cellvibrio sp.]